MQDTALTWIKEVGPTVLSWPTIGLIFIVFFRKQLLEILKQLGSADKFKAKIGPVEIERELKSLAEKGHLAVSRLNRISELMAESRLLELEITESNFGPVFSADQQKRMKEHIEELRNLTSRK
jgi:hypothetical protein